MKTLWKLVRRYVATTVGIVLLILAFNVAAFIGIIVFNYEKYEDQATGFYVREIAGHFVQEPDGSVHPGPQNTVEDWANGWAWGMMLDDGGNIIWRYQLPGELDHPYTVSEIVSFTRWYLDGYPVFSHITEYGVLVMAMPKGSIYRYTYYVNARLMDAQLGAVPRILLIDLALLLGPCLWMAFRMYRSLKTVGQGIEGLAQGRPVEVPEQGVTAELAGQLNRTGGHLRRQEELIARRDSARTEWIAGVSHDIRTPLALIFGYAEQLEADESLPPEARQKGKAIRAQGQRIRSLIEDLNLTSKLQYNAQPLRRATVQAGRLLRQAVVDFCNVADCPVEFSLTPEADRALLDADAALLARALENLLNNSARHNPGGCTVTVQAERQGDSLHLEIADDGAGYPPAVLAVLQGGTMGENPPHVLGLHVVSQIIAAHGGAVIFTRNDPHGARTCITLPCGDAAETPLPPHPTA